MTTMTIVLLIAGLVLLVAGAELMVRGASRLALGLGISPLLVGLTVMAYGTSAPELAISVGAALNGQPDIALGNVIGSNIANVLLILGISAIVAPLVVSRQLVWLDVPIMVGVSILVMVLAWDGQLSRGSGVALLAGAVAYTLLQIYMARRELPAGSDPPEKFHTPLWKNLLLLAVGLALLVMGARWLVGSAVTIAQALGVSELVIGLTVVAVGTSLPELATSVVAAMRGERDIAVGNIVGSNLFNLLMVLGAAVALSPGGMAVSAAAVNFDFPVMTAVAVACLPIFFTGHCIQRWEGALFLGYYVAYTTYLLLNAAGHEALPAFSQAMMLFVVPLTVITLLVVTVRTWRSRSTPAA
ncbi:MAG: calcium/sodium antiporter [Pseudoxanthomonas sp.]|nr:calcium/sodium antiporter [Pseudoxanthomonas sp.]